MKYGVRLALGLILGLIGVASLAFFVEAWWIVAIVGGLLAAVGFLGSFFVWTADRPDEGYEQVLFDRPNIIVTVLLLVALSGLAYGAALLNAPDGPSLPPEEAAAMVAMTEHQAKLQAIMVEYQTDAKDDAAKVAEWLEAAKETRTAVGDLDVPERLADLQASLKSEASHLVATLEAQEKCLAEDTAACVDARVGFSDVQRAEKKYFEDAKTLGVL